MTRLLALLAIVLLAPATAGAADWGGVTPGITTIKDVRDRYGAPSKQATLKVEGYDTTQWIYEGAQAPTGLVRMTVDFGLLTAPGYNPSLVRIMKLEPKPLIFGRYTVVQAWGVPDGITRQEGLLTFFYKDGLFVIFDKEEENATTMVFSVPQPTASNPSPAPKQ
jgi:hypothetical protein